jgi:hypothetical protein
MSEQEPTPDEVAAWTWWRGLNETEQAYWGAVAAGTTANPTPADAWAAMRRVTQRSQQPGRLTNDYLPSGASERNDPGRTNTRSLRDAVICCRD